MGQEDKYESVINLIIAKYCPRSTEKEDLRQEAQLIIFEKRKEISEHKTPDKFVYSLVRNKIIDYLRKTPPVSDDISEDRTRRKYEKQSVHFPDEDTKLDAKKIIEVLETLSEPYRYILKATFGLINGNPVPEKLIAYMCGKSEDWVNRQKKIGIKKLRNLMKIKEKK